MTKLFALMLACLALGLVAAGCGGDDDSGGSSAGSSDQPAGGYGGGGGGGGGDTKVSMENVQFSPKDLTVKAGQTVTFTNNDSVPHDVHKTSGPGGDFASGDTGGMQKGDTFEVKLDKPGKYEYVCELHQPGMSGTITVK
jgi:plastocyanin